MKFSKLIKKLKKNKTLSSWPPSWMPFAMVIIFLIEGYFFPFENLKSTLYYLAGFTFLYAIVHWIVVRNMNR